METGSLDRKLRLALKLSALLFSIVLAQALAIIWLWQKPLDPSRKPERSFGTPPNPIQKRYPFVDFSKIYPDLSSVEIDQLQRECFNVRYVYAPFVQFEPWPVTNRFVQVSSAGFRHGAEAQPWPPRDEDFVVFVFGGSTTFSYGLPDHGTLVALLERELRQLWPDKRVQCYNFGRGFYFSTQERLLFERLLQEGHLPDLAIFVDGLNDFYYATGKPHLTQELSRCVAGDLAANEPPPSDAKSKALEVQKVIERLKNHTRLTRLVGEACHVATVFIGQPVPFLDYPKTSETYPFRNPMGGHELCAEFYPEFQKAAQRGEFGTHFIWCGDVFAEANTSMYADSIHYSPSGASLFARAMASRIHQKLRPQAGGSTAHFQRRGESAKQTP